MSLLTICQQVAREIPLEIPTVIYGNTNETASLLLACAQAEGKSLQRRHNWVSLVTEYTFNTANGTADYSLPSAFSRMVDGTVWDRANYWDMRGPLTPQQWQQYKSSVLSSTVTTNKRYRVRNVSGTVQFSIDPTPTSIDACVFEYVSKNWCESSLGTDQSAWAADTDTGILDEYLMERGILWRMLKRLGMEYEAEKAEYDREVDKAVARDGGRPVLSLSKRSGLFLIGPHNVPDTGYGS